MKLMFSPQRRDAALSLERTGDVLSINGEEFDFSGLPDGATLPLGAIASEWITGDVTREDGILIVPIVLPHGKNAPEQTRFPAPATLAADGPVSLPPYSVEGAT